MNKDSMSRTGWTTIRGGTVLMEVVGRKVVVLPETSEGRMGVHPSTHETVYNINGVLYFNERYTKKQLELETTYRETLIRIRKMVEGAYNIADGLDHDALQIEGLKPEEMEIELAKSLHLLEEIYDDICAHVQ